MEYPALSVCRCLLPNNTVPPYLLCIYHISPSGLYIVPGGRTVARDGLLRQTLDSFTPVVLPKRNHAVTLVESASSPLACCIGCWHRTSSWGSSVLSQLLFVTSRAKHQSRRHLSARNRQSSSTTARSSDCARIGASRYHSSVIMGTGVA